MTIPSITNPAANSDQPPGIAPPTAGAIAGPVRPAPLNRDEGHHYLIENAPALPTNTDIFKEIGGEGEYPSLDLPAAIAETRRMSGPGIRHPRPRKKNTGATQIPEAGTTHGCADPEHNIFDQIAGTLEDQKEESEAAGDVHPAVPESPTPGPTDDAAGDGADDPAEGPDAPTARGNRIPDNINTLSLLESARFYVNSLGHAVFPIRSIHDERAQKPGKEPLNKGYKKVVLANCTEDYLAQYFSTGSNYNIGGISREDLVWIDIDAKKDRGQSAREWLATHPEWQCHPRVSTLNGFHILVRVRDLPAKAKKDSQKISDNLTIELLVPGEPCVLPPSLRLDEEPYQWETFGEIPEFSWDCLRAALGFENRNKSASRNHGHRERRFAGDLSTLDLLPVLREQGLLREQLDPETGKWGTACPWRHEHSDGGTRPDSSSVVFVQEGRTPAFKCSHGHCAERGIFDLCGYLDDADPGVIDRHCEKRRFYRADDTVSDSKLPLIQHPGPGKLLSEIGKKLGHVIGGVLKWFVRSHAIVQIGRDAQSGALRMREVTPVEACSAIEEFVTPVAPDVKDGDTLIPKSFDRETIGKLLAAPQFKSQLPVIARVLSAPVAILDAETGQLVDLQPGYNPGHELFVSPEFGEIERMEPEEGRRLLLELLEDFCFETEQDRVHALARIITPYLRMIMGWTARTPLWFFMANRPRAGKDYLAMIALIIYEGEVREDSPLERGSEETRKRLTAAQIAGRRFMHFANCQNHLDDPALTSRVIAVRKLGGSDATDDLCLPNEIEYSLSANVGITLREDLNHRSRRISLSFGDEDPNSRTFRYPDLHGRIRRDRPRYLGAIHSLVVHWVQLGFPAGPTPFTSYPEFARVVGGVMVSNGLGDPCLPHASQLVLGGDLKERAMRAVYSIGFAQWPDAWVAKDELFQALARVDNDDLNFFGLLTGEDEKKTRTRIGMALKEYNIRILAGVRLEIDPAGTGGRQRVRFSRVDPGSGCDRQPGDETGSENAGECDEPCEVLRTLRTLRTLGGAGGLGGNSLDENVQTESNDPPSSGACEGSQGSQGSQSRASVPRLATCRSADARSATPRSQSPAPVSSLSPRTAYPAIARSIAAARVVALEVGPTDPARNSRCLRLAVPGGQEWEIGLRDGTGNNLGQIKAALELSVIVVHGARRTLGLLRSLCGLRIRRVFCTLTADKLLTNGSAAHGDLAEVLSRHPGDADAVSGVGRLHDLRTDLQAELYAAGLSDVSDLEMGLIPVVADIEAAGVPVDREELERRRAEAIDGEAQARADLSRLSGERDFNPNRPAQVMAALGRLDIDVSDTGAATLEPYSSHAFVVALMDFRHHSHVAGLLAGLAKHLGDDGRIHTDLDPLGAETGRFSSSNPSLHSIPRGDVRRVFRPPPGMVFVKGDYSQIDLRVAAAIAGEEEMLQAFRDGCDIHRLTASRVTGKPPEEVSPDERQEAKAVNFGFIYGQQAAGFMSSANEKYGLDLTLGRATRLRRAFFNSYPAFNAWHGSARVEADSGLSEVRTRLGRRRLLPPELSNWTRFSQAVNTPVQGTAADGMKMALITLHRRLPENCLIVLTVHDDVLVECPEAEAEAVRLLVGEVLRESMARLVPEVPIEVETRILEVWE